MITPIALLLGLLTSTAALRVPELGAVSRRAALFQGAAGLSALLPPFAAHAGDKGYITLSEYQEIKRKEKKDEDLYGLFESLRTRAGQTGEFDKLAEGDKLQELSKLALAWDSNIRKDLLDK